MVYPYSCFDCRRHQTTETDAHVVILKAKACELESQLVTVPAQLANVKNQQSPIYRLPHELLPKILYDCNLRSEN
jgi:hypothetical protein